MLLGAGTGATEIGRAIEADRRARHLFAGTEANCTTIRVRVSFVRLARRFGTFAESRASRKELGVLNLSLGLKKVLMAVSWSKEVLGCYGRSESVGSLCDRGK